MVNFDINEVRRLNLVRLKKERKLKNVDLVAMTGYKPSFISALLKNTGEKGSSNIGPKVLLKLQGALNVDADEFHRMDVLSVEIYPTTTMQVPVISWIQAGALHEALDPWPVGVSGEQDCISTGKTIGANTFALRIEGDSMYPRYMPGDIIIVDPTVRCENGDKCVVYLNGEVTFKKFKETDDEIRLIPLNDKYEDRVIPKSRPIDFRVIGKVVDMKPKL